MTQQIYKIYKLILRDGFNLIQGYKEIRIVSKSRSYDKRFDYAHIDLECQ